MIKWSRIVAEIFLYVMIVIFSIYFHELSHCFMCEIFGGKCYGIGFNWNEFYAYARIGCNDIICRRVTLIAGSFLNIFLMSIIALIGNKKKILSIYIAGYSMIMGDFFYWGLSPLIGFGDAHMLLDTMPSIDKIFFSTIMLITTAYVFFRYIYGVKKIFGE